MATDVVLRAMVDEIDRGLAGLQLEDLKAARISSSMGRRMQPLRALPRHWVR
ncbi:MAG: hypothetical protein R3E58_06975 [Phycisphaerae bacterium]